MADNQKIKLSICIPTYNRAKYLQNCLNSIIKGRSQNAPKFEVCISDNNSTDETQDITRHFQDVLDIKYHRNTRNLGIPRNFLNAVSMADGEFIWLIGDDDLLMPNAIVDLYRLIGEHPTVDFFYVNSYHLTTEYLTSYPSPFDTANLPAHMVPFSPRKAAGELPFFELIDPKISFDFLGGMFLSVFRKRNWELNIGVLDSIAIRDDRTFSHFDNTFPHVKIWAKAFSSSTAYFNPKPLIVCLTGAREWASMYPLITSVRLIEALDAYRQNGLRLGRYIYCKNFALRNFAADFANIIIYQDKCGYAYIKPLRLFFSYCLYPNTYLSPFYFIARHADKLLRYYIYSWIS